MQSCTNPIIEAIILGKNLSKEEVYAQLNQAYQQFAHVGQKAKDAQGRTPLMIAARELNEHAVEWLLDKAQHKRLSFFKHIPGINAVDKSGCTALAYAVAGEDAEQEFKSESQHIEPVQKRRKIIDLLLNHQADPLKVCFGVSAPTVAAKFKNYYFLRKFFSQFPMSKYKYVVKNHHDIKSHSFSNGLHENIYSEILKIGMEAKDNNLLDFLYNNNFFITASFRINEYYDGSYTYEVNGFMGPYKFLYADVFLAIQNRDYDRAELLLRHDLYELSENILDHALISIHDVHNVNLLNRAIDFIKFVVKNGFDSRIGDSEQELRESCNHYDFISNHKFLSLPQKKELYKCLSSMGLHSTEKDKDELNSQLDEKSLQTSAAPTSVISVSPQVLFPVVKSLEQSKLVDEKQHEKKALEKEGLEKKDTLESKSIDNEESPKLPKTIKIEHLTRVKPTKSSI